MKKIIIGSRGSDLALWQANHVKSKLESGGHEVEIKIIVTQGDAFQNLSFDKLEGKGFFTKEIEKELLEGNIDLAVHSHKDLETNPPKGLKIAAVSEREDPSELLLIRKEKVSNDQKWGLMEGALVGTSSARRQSLLRTYRPDLQMNELRGNVPTRIEKLRQGNYDAILLAKAGVDRLRIDLSEFEVCVLNPTEFVPAPAQGVLGLQIREGDLEMEKALSVIHHKDVFARISIERKVLNLLDGGCRLPLGVYCPDEQTAHVSYASELGEAAVVRQYDLGTYANPAESIVESLLVGNE
ncbi:MAG: hydroxymethylbilane synthase [Bacteroidetes bacterium]|nr:MAG: hydroxymethylbilane synthase [Bacteroidota bacterium]